VDTTPDTAVAAAGVPDDVAFATRSHLADDMITAAVHAQVLARWVAADEAYGNNTALRAGCANRVSATPWR
jgi:SRSO17 transposase